MKKGFTALRGYRLSYLKSRYQSGESLLQLSKETGIIRITLMRKFKAAGINLRNRSEAELLKWKNMKKKLGRAAVERQCTAAWIAARSRKITIEEKIKKARTRYMSMTHRGVFEDSLANALRKLKFKIEQQFPLERYNIDIAICLPKIAIEVTGTCENPLGPRYGERSKFILSSGWNLVYVFIRKPPFDAQTVAASINSFANKIGKSSKDPAQIIQLLGDGNPRNPVGVRP